jgi:hypothetical protein
MNDTFVKLAALLPAAWCMWACIGLPIFLLIIATLAALSKPKIVTVEHKHNWRDITPAGDPKYKTKITKTKHANYGIYTWREKCDDCGEERDRGATGYA